MTVTTCCTTATCESAEYFDLTGPAIFMVDSTTPNLNDFKGYEFLVGTAAVHPGVKITTDSDSPPPGTPPSTANLATRNGPKCLLNLGRLCLICADDVHSRAAAIVSGSKVPLDPIPSYPKIQPTCNPLWEFDL